MRHTLRRTAKMCRKPVENPPSTKIVKHEDLLKTLETLEASAQADQAMYDALLFPLPLRPPLSIQYASPGENRARAAI